MKAESEQRRTMGPIESNESDSVRTPDGRHIPWRTVRGFSAMRFLAWLVLRASGWKVEGRVPDLPKMVAILGQHTSNWDAIWTIALKYVLIDRPVGWVMKDTAFRFPFRTLLLWLGCIPVSRKSPEGFVEQVSRQFMAGKLCAVSIAPEGTRNRVDRWKTGFYRIAEECGVPIVPVFLDYKRRVMGAGPIVWTTGDYDADMRELARFYATVTPRHPELASEVR